MGDPFLFGTDRTEPDTAGTAALGESHAMVRQKLREAGVPEDLIEDFLADVDRWLAEWGELAAVVIDTLTDAGFHEHDLAHDNGGFSIVRYVFHDGVLVSWALANRAQSTEIDAYEQQVVAVMNAALCAVLTTKGLDTRIVPEDQDNGGDILVNWGSGR